MAGSSRVLLILSTAVICCCLSSHGSAAGISSGCIENDRRALLAIKSDMHGRWLSSWIGDDCCKWEGVDCDGITGHVTSLDLHYPESDRFDDTVVSKVNPSLIELKYLRYLNLGMNNFGGASIPEIIDSLVYLDHLDLSNAMFAGTIPPQLGNLSSLEELDLSNNNIGGQIPESMGRLCNLSTLDLSYNNFSGKIKHLLDGLSSNCPHGAEILSLNLEGNKLSGIIPSSLGQLEQLEELHLSSNSLQGNITESHFSRLTNLHYLNISHNNIYVMLPDDWNPPFDAYSIILSFCRMGGKLPEWIRTQTNLQQLHLSGVGLSGKLPVWFSELSFLQELDLSSNYLDGPLPSTPSTLMDLSNNSFVGSIPRSFWTSTRTVVLSLSHNNITGSIPSNFCNLTSLRVLDLSGNHLCGIVPNCHGSSPTSLQSLHLSNNNLSGSLPFFLTQCKELMTLDLGENNFSGEIPAWPGRNLSKLQVLRLTSNQLHGVFPTSLAELASLQVLDLSSNNLYGIIPSSIGSLNSMIRSIPSSVQDFSSMIRSNPSSIGDFSSLATKQSTTNLQKTSGCHTPRFGIIYTKVQKTCGCYTSNKSCVIYSAMRNPIIRTTTSSNFYKESIVIRAKGSSYEYTSVLYSLVTSIDLSNNNLSGDIPDEINSLVNLVFLNLSNNHLTGRIPERIGVMKQLESLDLSVNNLIGVIPPNISALCFLSHLNLSYNNLSGKIPSGGQLSTLNQSVYVGNKDLCGYPLRDCSSDGTDHQGPHLAAGDDEENVGQLEKVLQFSSIALGFVIGFWCYMSVMIVKMSMRITLFRMIDKACDWIYVQWAVRLSRMKSKWNK